MTHALGTGCCCLCHCVDVRRCVCGCWCRVCLYCRVLCWSEGRGGEDEGGEGQKAEGRRVECCCSSGGAAARGVGEGEGRRGMDGSGQEGRKTNGTQKGGRATASAQAQGAMHDVVASCCSIIVPSFLPPSKAPCRLRSPTLSGRGGRQGSNDISDDDE